MKKTITILPLLTFCLLPATSSYSCDKKEALRMEATLTRMAAKEVRGNTVIFRLNEEWNAMNKSRKEKMMQNAADADACLAGYRREIKFYSTEGNLAGIASPARGVKILK